METARMAGWVLAVLRSSSSGPSKSSRKSPPPSAASASSSTARASGWASASAWPMPTDCEPCPGNTNASGISFPRLPAHERAAPGHSAADGHHQHQVAVLELSLAVGLIERERHRRRRGVPHLLDVEVALLQWDLELPHYVLEDAQVRLVGDDVVDVLRAVAVAHQRLARDGLQRAHRGLVDLAAVHLDVLGARLEHPGAEGHRASAARDVENVRLRAVRVHVAGGV